MVIKCLRMLGVFLPLAMFSLQAFAQSSFIDWVKETDLSGYLRNQYFHREYSQTVPDNADYALGLKLKFETQEWKSMQLGATLYSAQDFGLNSEGKGVYRLVSSGPNGKHQGMTVLGEAYLKFSLENTSLKVGRQVLKTPWMNSYDIRMTPITYEAVKLEQKINNELNVNLYYIHAAKPWTRTSFVSISKFKGVSQNYGVAVAGFKYSKNSLKLQLWDYFLHNVHNSIYARADYNFKLNDEWTLISNLRYGYMTDAEESLAGKIDTYLGGIQLGVKGHGFTNVLAYSKIGKNDFTITLGHDMAVAGQIVPCNSSQQNAYMMQSKYDFAEIGVDGLSVLLRYILFNEPGTGPHADQDKTEFNVDLNYKFKGILDDWSIRLRYAILDEKDDPQAIDIKDYRAYITYSF